MEVQDVSALFFFIYFVFTGFWYGYLLRMMPFIGLLLGAGALYVGMHWISTEIWQHFGIPALIGIVSLFVFNSLGGFFLAPKVFQRADEG